MKKSVIAFFIIATLTIGSGAAYASDLNLDEKIQQFMDKVINQILVQLEDHTDDTNATLIAEINTTTKGLLENAKRELTSFGGTEKTRISTELGSYKEQKIEEVKKKLGNNSNKKRIEDKANAEITAAKAAIDAEVEKILSGK